MVLKPETKTQNISKVKKTFDIVFVITENSMHSLHVLSIHCKHKRKIKKKKKKMLCCNCCNELTNKVTIMNTVESFLFLKTNVHGL